MAFISLPQPYVSKTYKFSSIITSTDAKSSIRQHTGDRNWKSLNKLIHLSCKHLENVNVLSYRRKHLIFVNSVQNSNKEQYLKDKLLSFLYYVGVRVWFYISYCIITKLWLTYKCLILHVAEVWTWINSGQLFQTGHSGTCFSRPFFFMSYCCPLAALCYI